MAAIPRASVLFVCVHNAGRSQMAAAWLRHLSRGRVEVRSAGTLPAEQINPQAVTAMSEVGIDLLGLTPRVLTPEMVKSSDYVITMGCGDTCPVFPGKQYRDWALQDPAGQGLDVVRRIRDEIRGRVGDLVAEIDRNAHAADISGRRADDAA
ncbi:arsenate reductase ArsC [Streptomyces sp. NPDC057411]|uniref:arsenate reductase ArsC n=1 Tax=unclassified Streptomyces TaxID=2593676 RepID=UPI00363A2FE1